MREAAAGALGQIGDARAVEPLIAVLKDSREHVRMAAADALDKIGWRPGQDESGAPH
jgi:HEAT repeat protein